MLKLSPKFHSQEEINAGEVQPFVSLALMFGILSQASQMAFIFCENLSGVEQPRT